jgi:hypothetical protein
MAAMLLAATRLVLVARRVSNFLVAALRFALKTARFFNGFILAGDPDFRG